MYQQQKLASQPIVRVETKNLALEVNSDLKKLQKTNNDLENFELFAGLPRRDFDTFNQDGQTYSSALNYGTTEATSTPVGFISNYDGDTAPKPVDLGREEIKADH